MSNLEPRGGRRLSRGQRTDKAFNLVVATGGLTVAAIVAFVVVGAGLGLLLLIAAAISGYLLKNTLS